MSKKELQHLLRKYLKDECTPDEIDLVEKWSDRIADPDLGLDQLEKVQIQDRLYRNIQKSMKGRTRVVRWQWPAAAAVALLAAFCGYWLVTKSSHTQQNDLQFSDNGNNIVVVENSQSSIETVQLPDGSTIALKPGGRISYDARFGEQKREVWLTGEAFFEVTRDSERPFFVYGSNVVTQVLGTSFLVKAPANTTTIEVEVKTGRVSVYENKGSQEIGKSEEPIQKPANGVVLTPNQKVVYYIEEHHWVTGLVEEPQPVNTAKPRVALVFENASLQEIIQSMEEDYGIEFATVNDNIFNCTFTGDVSGMTLYDALDVIAKSIGAVYEVKGTRILIDGSGCE